MSNKKISLYAIILIGVLLMHEAFRYTRGYAFIQDKYLIRKTFNALPGFVVGIGFILLSKLNVNERGIRAVFQRILASGNKWPSILAFAVALIALLFS